MKKINVFLLLVAVMMIMPATISAQDTDRTPVKRPVIEEYTGTWCGWCVRGLVAMELLRETFGEDFVGVAYHNGDPMQIMNANGYPNSISGYPSAFLDRKYDVDPYYGFSSGTPAQIVSDMQQLAEIATIADLIPTAKWADEEKTKIQVDASCYFTNDDNSGRYALEFMLVADDLYGTASSWGQSNYYSSNSSYSSDPYLSPWISKPSTVTGIHFNDVLIATSKVLNSSLPTEIVAYQDYTYTHTFLLNRIPKPALVQNKDNLHIIVLIVDKNSNKAIVNANRCYIDDYQNPVLLGDANGDGLVNTADVSALIVSLLVDDMSEINVENADLDGDGRISLGDVTALIGKLLNE